MSIQDTYDSIYSRYFFKHLSSRTISGLTRAKNAHAIATGIMWTVVDTDTLAREIDEGRNEVESRLRHHLCMLEQDEYRQLCSEFIEDEGINTIIDGVPNV